MAPGDGVLLGVAVALGVALALGPAVLPAAGDGVARGDGCGVRTTFPEPPHPAMTVTAATHNTLAKRKTRTNKRLQ